MKDWVLYIAIEKTSYILELVSIATLRQYQNEQTALFSDAPE